MNVAPLYYMSNCVPHNVDEFDKIQRFRFTFSQIKTISKLKLTVYGQYGSISMVSNYITDFRPHDFGHCPDFL